MSQRKSFNSLKEFLSRIDCSAGRALYISSKVFPVAKQLSAELLRKAQPAVHYFAFLYFIKKVKFTSEAAKSTTEVQYLMIAAVF